jgi:hypothetical protein
MKAQVAIEFMMIFGVFLLGITIVALAAWNNIANAEKSSMDFEARRILNLISGRINTVYLEGHGFSIGLAVPEKIGVSDYAITIDENTLWLELNGVSYTSKLLASNITGSVKRGENTLTNVNGAVVLS